MSNVMARTSDHGFYLSFKVDVDLTTMTGARLGIKRPKVAGAVLRALPAASWDTLAAGDTLNVEITSTDFTDKGEYVFQVFARRMNGQTEEVAFSSEPYSLVVDDPVVINPWQDL